MSLLGALNIGRNALIANQVGIQVTGNNIANANTEGYVREDAVFQPAPNMQLGQLRIGLGVEVKGIVQRTDRFLEERLRSARSDVEFGDAQESAYLELEGLISELTDSDLSTKMIGFFSNIQDILNQPEEKPLRGLAIATGSSLAQDFQRVFDQVNASRNGLNRQIGGLVDQINSILSQVAGINQRIVESEAGSDGSSSAGGMRNERSRLLGDLSKLINVRIVEQDNGSVAVFNGGDFLVFDNDFRELKVETLDEAEQDEFELRFVDTDARIEVTSGKIAGLAAARDDVLGGFVTELEEFARTFIYEFNKVFSAGQGTTAFDELVSEYNAADPTAALDQAGLPFTPENGSFQVLVYNNDTDTVEKTTDIFVRLNGFDDDTTLESLAAELNAIDGLSAEITPENRLEIKSDFQHLGFGFANDNSGALAALGLNTFFTGGATDASALSDFGVRKYLLDDPNKFAISRNGFGTDAENAEALADFYGTSLESRNGSTLAEVYEDIVGDVSQASAVSRSVAEGFRVFERTLEGQFLAISGVNLDEEAVKMMSYQRSFQASARFISVLNDLLDVLLSL